MDKNSFQLALHKVEDPAGNGGGCGPVKRFLACARSVEERGAEGIKKNKENGTKVFDQKYSSVANLRPQILKV